MLVTDFQKFICFVLTELFEAFDHILNSYQINSEPGRVSFVVEYMNTNKRRCLAAPLL